MKKNKVLEGIYTLMAILFFLLLLIPFHYWYNNPELTSMQVFRKFMPLIFFTFTEVILTMLLGFYIIKNED